MNEEKEKPKKSFWKDAKNIIILILIILLLAVSSTKADEQVDELKLQVGNLSNQVNTLTEDKQILENTVAEKDGELEKANNEIANLTLQMEELSQQDNEVVEADTSSEVISQETVTSSNEDSYTVYITKTGSKYHTSSCRYLRSSKIAIDKNQAIAEGYTACSVCNP